MSNEVELDLSKRSVVVKMLADVASQGTYNGITVAGMRNMNAVFVLIANLINDLELEEKEVALVEEVIDNE